MPIKRRSVETRRAATLAGDRLLRPSTGNTSDRVSPGRREPCYGTMLYLFVMKIPFSLTFLLFFRRASNIDWHRYNQQLKLKGCMPVSKAEFDLQEEFLGF